MGTEKCARFAKKTQSALKYLESVLGHDWDEDLLELKLRITTKGDHNLLDCLLYGAAQMKSLLIERQQPCDDHDGSSSTDVTADDAE